MKYIIIFTLIPNDPASPIENGQKAIAVGNTAASLQAMSDALNSNLSECGAVTDTGAGIHTSVVECEGTVAIGTGIRRATGIYESDAS